MTIEPWPDQNAEAFYAVLLNYTSFRVSEITPFTPPLLFFRIHSYSTFNSCLEVNGLYLR